MREFVFRFAEMHEISSLDDMKRIGLDPTKRQREAVMKRVTRSKNPIPFREAWVDQFVSDKYGAATTHWTKLEDRIRRGVGNPCPLVLIGLPPNLVTFGEKPDVVAKLIEEANADGEDNRRPEEEE